MDTDNQYTMTKILSIIIPTYNMEALLDQCLTSLILPEEYREMLDVIVVIDGAKDRSSEIAHRYSAKHPETFTVIDKENGNYGSCINAALPHVKGKYVRVLDADDSYYTKNLQEYIQVLQNIDVDMVLSDYDTVDATGNIISNSTYPIQHGYILIFSDLPESTGLAMHGVAYRSSIFREIDYHQTEGVSYTDMEWIFHPLTKVKTIYYFNKPVYRYLLGREGQTVDMITMIKRLDHRVKGLWTQLSVLQNVSRDNAAYNRLVNMVNGRVSFIYTNALSKYSTLNLNDFDKELKNRNLDIYNTAASFTMPVGMFGLQMPIVRMWRNVKSKIGLLIYPVYDLHLLSKLIRR